MTTIIELKKENVWQEVKKTLAEVWSRSKGAELERLKQLIESELGVTTEWEIKDFYNKAYLLKFTNIPETLEKLLEKVGELFGGSVKVYIALFYAYKAGRFRDDTYLSNILNLKGETYIVDIPYLDNELVVIPLFPPRSLEENIFGRIMFSLVVEKRREN
ncbi:MAG: hypothetical protein RMI04_08860 [Thermofilaceae archaeon]|nr:hypothetical protein [Thermofilaceae archaeon]